MPPRIQPGPRVMKVQVGHQVELTCVATGSPEPTLTWTKDGTRYPVSPEGSLNLRKVGLDDEGTFTCTATNAAGRDEAQVRVLVQGWFHGCSLCWWQITRPFYLRKKSILKTTCCLLCVFSTSCCWGPGAPLQQPPAGKSCKPTYCLPLSG